MRIRGVCPQDLDAVTAVEAECFPAAEAATHESFRARIAAFPGHFWVLEDEGTIVGFINGMVTDRPTIEDVMYEHAGLHQPEGAWQTVFGLDVLPAYRRQGLAARLLRHLIEQARREGRRGCVLTCKEALRHYYERFGFVCGGVSASVHGGVVWYDMTLRFEEA